ncbi:unnamed protein product [Phytophthora fragariaefolia]|uniref:Unnamed protein product n=1 Tax=Phytophthora fragariaefolia TaxID=1490495 RepID=A0A9W7CVE5_9STRA|nr:unnamed protein product [Phytophthora fragariaefolia]
MDGCEPGQEGAVLAGAEVAVETEEYAKDLEEQLFPLDEVELKKRVDENGKRTEDPPIEEMTKYLRIPPETLERNRDGTSEAKRANRDFRKSVVTSTVHRAGASSKVVEDFGLGEANNVWEKVGRAEVFTSDAVVCANVLVLLTEGEAFTNADIGPSESKDEVVMGASPSMTKAIARRVVYVFLKEALVCRPERKPPKERLIVNGGTLEVPLMRDKVPELYWKQGRDLVDQVAKGLGVLGDCMPSGSSQIRGVVVGLDFLVADQLHVDSILGVEVLGVFGAVTDVAERKMTLKRSSDVLPLGVMVVHETFMATMETSVRLHPRGQALVVTRAVGKPDDMAVVLVEGSVGLPPSLCVARMLCTVDHDNVIVELCNASTEEY